MIPVQRAANPRCTVLICDDRLEIREAITTVISGIPRFQLVGQAVDGPSCTDQVRDLRPDVLILDVNMPEGGPSVAAQIKALHPAIYIMVYSANQFAEVRLGMISAGADEYIIKTGRLSGLLAGLDHAFEQWSARTGSG